jgi:hypothetical protein
MVIPQDVKKERQSTALAVGPAVFDRKVGVPQRNWPLASRGETRRVISQGLGEPNPRNPVRGDSNIDPAFIVD